VTLRDPNLRAITKAGYFAPNANAPVDRRQQNMIDLAEAMQSNIPFHALSVGLSDPVRYPDVDSVEFTVQLNSKNLTFQPTEDGKSAATLILAAASLDNDRNVLASRTETLTVQSNTPDPRPLSPVTSSMKLAIRVPRKTQSVRVVVQDEDGERMGAAELDSKTIAAAPAREMPVPQLKKRPPAHTGGAGPQPQPSSP